MGARVYLPILGRFLQVDPVEGGTDNNYAYANDLVNEFDLDGRAIPVFFLLGSVARMAAPHIARAAVKYIAKPAVRVAVRRVVPLFKKGAGHVARWGVNSFKKFTGSRLPKFVTRGPGAAQNLRESLAMCEAIGRGVRIMSRMNDPRVYGILWKKMQYTHRSRAGDITIHYMKHRFLPIYRQIKVKSRR